MLTQASRAARAASRSSLTASLALGIVGALAVASPGRALAQAQLVAFDATFTFLEKGNLPGLEFHHMIKPAATEPASWLAPIDYSKGTAYFHIEVMDKPSAKGTTLTVCFDGNLDAYGCITSAPWTTPGVFDSMKPLSSTWQYTQIAWGKRRQEYHLVIKDDKEKFPNPAADFVPSKVRVVMTIVPPGGTYTPPIGAAPFDGGAAADASAPRDTGSSETPPSTGGRGGNGTGGSSGGSSGGSASGGSSGSSTGSGGSSSSGSGGTTSTAAGGSSGRAGSFGSGEGGLSGTPNSSGGSSGSNSGGSASTKASGCSFAPTAAGGSASAAFALLLTIAGLGRRRRRR